MSTTTEGKNVMVQGRIVWASGDVFKGKIKVDQNTKQPIIDQKTGQPKMEYGFGLAVPKSAFAQMGPGEPGEIWAASYEEAYKIYPSRQMPPDFAWKRKDGDTDIDQNGVPFSQRTGYAGHIVFALTTSLPIKFFRFENGQNYQINEGIKCGDYVNVQVTVKAHPKIGQGKPGLYLNPNAVQLLGYGEEIINTPTGDQVFGTQAPALPPGASATPVAPSGFIVPPGMPQQQAYAPQAPMAPQAPIQPNYNVLPPIHQPQQQQAMPAMPQAPMGNGYPQMNPGMPPAPAAPAYPQSGQPTSPVGYATPAFPSNPQAPQGGAQGGMAPGGFPMPQFRR